MFGIFIGEPPGIADEKWADEVLVDSTKVKDIWFVVDQFHAFRGMSHTYLTFEFENGTCLSFSFETRRQRGKKYHPLDRLVAFV